MQNSLKLRNPLITTPMGNFIRTIGDTHLGRVFRNDVPLDRRGEYEKFQFDTLNDVLFSRRMPEEVAAGVTSENTICCQVGDWFDKAQVSASSILSTYDLLHGYNGRSDFEPLYILSGNHDDSKTVSEQTSWDILKALTDPMRKVKAIKYWKIHHFPNDERVLLVGWNVKCSVEEALLDAKNNGHSNITTVICHLDKTSFGNDDNVIPYEFLADQGIKMVISGHDHKPYHFWELGMEVIGTGSLLPYSHAEDANDDLYLTFTSGAELEQYVLEGNSVANKHIRVYVEDGEEVCPLLNVYSLKVLKKESLEEDLITGETIVHSGSFDAQELWKQAAATQFLNAETTDSVWREIKEQGIEE